MIKPVGDWMLLEIVEETKSDIVVPEAYRHLIKADKRTAFRVLDTGIGWREQGLFHAMPYKKGDIVIMEGMEVNSFEYGGKEYLCGQARYVAFVDECAYAPEDFVD